MIVILIISFLLGVGISSFVIPGIIKLSFKNGLFDKPNERKIHHTNIPRLGGTCFFPISLIVISILLIAQNFLARYWLGKLFLDNAQFILAGTLGSFVVFCFGVVDDLWGVRYLMKFIGQIVASVILCAAGLWIDNLHGIFGLYEIPMWLGWPITVFAVVLISNAINFIDGIDGLASNICVLALCYFTIAFGMIEEYGYMIISFVVIGPVITFMAFNIFGSTKNHTKTFMGDTGSLFLGYVLSALGIAMNRTLTEAHFLVANPMVIAFAPMILPCFDVLRVILIRYKQGKNPFVADKNHIHHKFLSNGFSQHSVLFIVSMLAIVMSGITIIMSIYLNVNLTLLISLLIWGLINNLSSKFFKKKLETKET